MRVETPLATYGAVDPTLLTNYLWVVVRVTVSLSKGYIYYMIYLLGSKCFPMSWLRWFALMTFALSGILWYSNSIGYSDMHWELSGWSRTRHISSMSLIWTTNLVGECGCGIRWGSLGWRSDVHRCIRRGAPLFCLQSISVFNAWTKLI